MSLITTEKELIEARESGRILAEVLAEAVAAVCPGITTHELNEIAEKAMHIRDAEPVFKGYKPRGARTPFPAAICISVNEEVVHGIPGGLRKLVEGDIVGIDAGVRYHGFITDAARTVPVGETDAKSMTLIRDTRKALAIGIAEARAGSRVGDIGAAIQAFAEPLGYGIVRELGGHGVGKEVHEDPMIPNYGVARTGAEFVAGMVIAIEPMLNIGTHRVVFDKKDGYTVRTADGSRSAHFEDTVLITDGEPEILTMFSEAESGSK